MSAGPAQSGELPRQWVGVFGQGGPRLGFGVKLNRELRTMPILACSLLLCCSRCSRDRLSAMRCPFTYMRQRDQYSASEIRLQKVIASLRCQIATYPYVADTWANQLAKAFDDSIYRKTIVFRVIISSAGTVVYVTSIAIWSPIELFQVAFEAGFRYFLTVTVKFPDNRAVIG